MPNLGIVFIGIGAIISLFFGIQLLVIAFRASVLWGLGYLFVPIVGLIFILTHWSDTKKPFLYSLLAVPLFIAGGFMVDGK